MVLSFIISIIAIFFSFLETKNTVKGGLKIAFIFLFLFLAFRYDFGNDYQGYLNNYMVLGGVDDTEFYYRVNELGWVYLNFFFKTLFGPPGFHLMVAAVSGFNCTVAYRFFKKYVPKPYYALAMLLFVLEPNNILVLSSAMRQSIAVSFFLISIDFLLVKKYLKYFFCILLGSLFHTTILVFIPLVLVNLFKWRIKFIYILLFYVLVFILITKSNELFSQLDLLLSLNESEYQSYTSDGQEVQHAGLGFILSLFLFFVVLFYNRNHEDGNKNSFIKFTLIAVFFLILGLVLNMAARLNYYIFPVIILCYIYTLQEQKKQPFIRTGLRILLITFYFYQHILFWISPVYGPYFREYKSIFQSPHL